MSPGEGKLDLRSRPAWTAVWLVLAVVVAVAIGAGGQPVTPELGSSLPSRMPESSGRMYYVDGERGADAGPGTLARPWRTITYALRRVPASGSVILVRAGTYGDMIRYERRGDPRNPVTLRPYPGEHVLLTAPPKSISHAIWIRRASALRVHGFEITAPTSNTGIKIENSDDIEILGCDIHHTGHSGLLIAGTGSTPPAGNRNIQVWNNRLHDNGGAWISENSFWRVGDHSVYWGGVSSNSDGIDHSTYGGVLANNLFYNQPYGFQVQIGSQASGLIVTNNTFYRANGPYPAGGSITLYTETRTPAYVTRDVLIVNNIITYAANKGVWGSGGGGLMSTNMVRNNLAYGNAQGDFLNYFGSASNVLFQLGSNLTGRRPLFVSARQLDFRLQPRSPAIGNADSAYATPTDFLGRSRVAAADLGAFEWVPKPKKKR